MTTVIDERVVEMRFNNDDFERNVKQSMDTLDKLKSSLNFDSANSLKNLGDATKGFSLNGISESITEVTSKFSALEIAGITAISKITSAAMDMGTKLIKSLSVDQITAGFDKYAEKTTSIQTIISATGAKIDEVTEQIDKLNWFTDETSYSLTDMTANIAKFTNAGIDLDKAVTQMMGIAAAAGDAGKGVQGATHAMEGFSKAMAQGYMSKTSWQWIQTSGMDTLKLKQAMLDAAVAAGQLTEAGDGMYKTLEGHLVTVEDFATNLKDKWMTAEVMEKGLSTYGNFANRLAEVIEQIDYEGTTSDFIRVLDDYKAGLIDVDEASQQLEVSSTDLKDILDELSSDEYDIGRHAFKMSQEAKTFAEAIDSVKDAVSTGWMTTFEMIFGNYEEAKKLWTGLANDLWEAFASGGAERNEILGFWKKLGGRDSLIAGVIDMANLLVKPLSTIKAAFKSMFPDTEGMANALYNLTRGFEDLMAKLQPSEQFLRDIYLTFKGIFTVGKLVSTIFLNVLKAVFPILQPFGSLLELIVHFTGYIGAVIITLADFVNETDIVKVAITLLASVFSKLFEVLKTVGTIFGGGIIAGIGIFISFIGKAATAIAEFAKKSQVITKVLNSIGVAFNKVKSYFTGFNKATEGVTTVVKHMEENFSGANDVIVQTGTLTRDTANEFQHAMTPMERFVKVLKTIGAVVGGAVLAVVAAIKNMGSAIKNFFTDFANRFKQIDSTSKGFFDHIKALFATIGTYFTDLGGKIKEFFDGFGFDTTGIAETFNRIGDAIKKFVSSIDMGKIAAIAFAASMITLVSAVVKLSKSISGVVDSVTGVIGTVNKILKAKFAPKNNVIMDLAKAFAIIAGSLALLTLVDDKKLEKVSDVMFKLIITFTACAAALKGLDFVFGKFMGNIKTPAISTSVLALAGSIAILAAAFYVLNDLTVKKDWPEKLKIIGLMLLELVAAAILVSRLAPKLSKGSVLLLALALSMKVMVDAMLKISGADLSNVEDNLIGFSILFGAMAVMVAAAGRIKLTTALSLILVAKALQMIFPQLMEAISAIDGHGMFTGMIDRVKKFIDDVKNFFIHLVDSIGIIATVAGALGAIGTIVGSIALLISLFKAIGSLGNLLKGVGVAAAGIGVAVILISKAMEKFVAIKKTMSAEDFDQVAGIIKSFIVAIGLCLGIVQLMSVLSNVAGKKLLKWTDNLAVNFAAAGVAFVSIGASMILIAGALKIASTINQDDIVKVGIVMGALMAIMAVVVGAASNIKSGIAVMTSLIGVVAALGILIGEIAIVELLIQNSDPFVLTVAAFGILAFLAMLAGILHEAGTIKSSLPIFATLALIIGSVAVIGAALYTLKGIPWDDLVGPMAAIGILIAALTVVVGLLSKLDTNIASAMGTVKLLIGAIAGIVAIGLVLYGLQGIPWSSFGPSIGAIVLVMLEMAGLMAAFIGLAKWMKGMDIGEVIGLLVAALSSLVVVGVVLGALSNISWDSFWPVIASIGVVMLEMIAFVGVMALIAKKLDKGDFIKTMLLLVAALASLGVVGYTLAKLSSIPWESFVGPMEAIAVVMGSMAVLVGVIGLVNSFLDGKQILGTLGMIVAATASLVVVAYTLAQLSTIPIDELKNAALVLGVMMGVLTAVTLVLGVLTGLIGAIAGAFGAGAAGFFALPALLLSFGMAMVSAGAALVLASASTIIFAKGLEALYDPLVQLASLDLLGLSGGLAALGLACLTLGVGLGVFGLGGIVGAAAFILLAAGLSMFGAAAETAVPQLQALADVNLKDISSGFISMALSGVSLVLGAAGVYLFAKAVETLATALQKLEGNKTTFSQFFTDAGSALTSGAAKVTGTAKAAGEKVAKAFEQGWRTILQWFSPPGIVTNFLADMGYALSDNGQLINIADGSAVSIGEAFSNGFMGSIEGLGGKFASYMSGLFGQMGSIIYKFDAALTNHSGQQISQYGANGMPTYIQNMKYGGKVTGDFSDKLKEVMSSQFDFNGLLKDNYLGLGDVKDALDDATEGLGDFGEGLDETSEKAGKAGKSVKEFTDSLKDTLSGQLDMFSKFELKMGVSADQMLENMRSNIDGFASWSHRMTVLAERFSQHGIADSLYKSLAELGPKGYETMNAFYQMTDEQLEQVRDLWATGLTLPEGQASIVGSGYQYMGEMAVQGFSNALNDHKAAHDAANGLGKAALDGLKEALDVHSPSQEAFKIGVQFDNGLGLGMTSSSGMAMLELCVSQVTAKILELFNENLSPENMGEVGEGVLANIFANLLGEDESTNPIVTAFVNALSQFEMIDEALTTFVEHIKEIINELLEMDDDESPSLLFYRIAQNCLQGFANALDEQFIIVQLALMTLCGLIRYYLDLEDLPGTFYDVGMNASLGLAAGIEDYADTAIAAAVALATAVATALSEALDVNSPSKVTRAIGNSVGEGFALGITDGAQPVYSAVRNLADGTVGEIESMNGRIADLIDNELDLNPTITPILDLSIMRAQLEEASAMFGSREASLGIGQNGGSFSANPEPTSINFTQNNYSPKALSRMEIYRQTRNQISMMKGVVANA